MDCGAEKTRVPLLMRDRSFYHTFLILAGTLILEQAVVLSVNLADNLMIGSYNETALAAVAAVNQIVFVVQQVIYGVTNGVIVLSSQYWGKQQTAPIRRLVSLGLRLEAALSLVFFAVVSLWPAQCVGLFVTDAAIIAEGVRYLHVIRFTFPFFAVTTVLLGAMRSVETVSLALKVSVVSLVTNCVINYILIFGHFGAPAMGVEGAALATVISRYAELLIVAGWVHANPEKNPYIVGAYRSLYLPGKLLKSIVIKGMPLLVNEALWSSGMAFLNQCYSTCGLDVVPAMNISNTLFNLASVVFLSLGNGVGILMGQLLGSDTTEDVVRDTNRKLLTLSVASGVFFGVLMAAFSTLFPRIYNTTDAVRQLATWLICIQAAYMPFDSYANATYFTLRSGGQTFVTFLFDSCFLWVCCVPLAYCLSRFTGISILPLFIICMSANLLKCVIGAWMLKQGKWIQNLTV